MNVVLSQRIKLFYRPKEIGGNTSLAAEALQWSYSNGELRAYNPGRLSVSIAGIEFGEDALNVNNLLLPDGQAKWKIDKKSQGARSFKFYFIDEYGEVRNYEVKLRQSSF